MIKYDNVQNFYLNGIKKSSVTMWCYDEDKRAWIDKGVITCKGWYKKASTVAKKHNQEYYYNN